MLIYSPKRDGNGSEEVAALELADDVKLELWKVSRSRSAPIRRAERALAVGVVAVAAWLLAACTTMQPAELPPDALRQAIRDGSLVESGAQIAAVTADGREHRLQVGSVSAESITGETAAGQVVEVVIDDIVALRLQRVDGTKTTLLAVGVGAMVALALVADALEDFLDIWEFE